MCLGQVYKTTTARIGEIVNLIPIACILDIFLTPFQTSGLTVTKQKRIKTKMSEPWRLSATQAVTLIKSNELSVEDYAKSLLARISERDPGVKAWAYLNPDLIIAEARKLDQVPAEKRGPLHGVAIGVKDVILTKGTEHDEPSQSKAQRGKAK